MSDFFEQMRADLAKETSGGGTHGAYQDVVIDGRVALVGHRNTLERFAVFNLEPEDLAGKRIIDLGCNLGQVVGHYSRWAEYGLGIDANCVFIKYARALFPPMVGSKCDFIHGDLNTFLQRDSGFRKSWFPGRQWNVMFALSVWDYLDQEAFCDFVQEQLDGTLFLEAHKEDGPPDPDKWFGILENRVKLKNIKLLGSVDRAQRLVFKGTVG